MSSEATASSPATGDDAPPTAPAQPSATGGGAADESPSNLLEIGLWVALVALSLLIRFDGLGDRPLHHDESLFSYYTWRIAAYGDYEYLPILHGPLYLYKTALTFILFGDSVYTARAWMALMGGLWPLTALLFRRRWGRGVALAAGALLALSPILLFYSRFFRHDIPVASWALIELAIAMWWWRRPESKSRATMFGAAILLPLGIKENWLITQFTFFLFLHAMLLVDAIVMWRAGWLFSSTTPGGANGPGERSEPRSLWEQPHAPRTIGSIFWRSTTIASLAMASVIGLWWMFMPAEMRQSRSPLIVLFGTVWVMALFDGFVLQRALAWHRGGETWGARAARGIAASWPGFLLGAALTTLFLNILFTHAFKYVEAPNESFRKTFEYWLGEHKKHRLKGPFHHYWTIIATYHWPLIAALLALVGAWVIRRGSRVLRLLAVGLLVVGICAIGWELMVSTTPPPAFYHWLDAKLHMTSLIHVWAALLFIVGGSVYAFERLAKGRTDVAFFAFWTCWSMAIYGYAGEKIPWVAVHCVLPLLLWFAAELVSDDSTAAVPTSGASSGRVSPTLPRVSWAVAVFVALLVMLDIVNDRRLVIGDISHPRERVVYNHTTPEIALASDAFRVLLDERAPSGEIPRFHVEGHVGWPMFFYTRGLDSYRYRLDTDAPDAEPRQAFTSGQFPAHELPWVDIILTDEHSETIDPDGAMGESHAWYRLPFRRFWTPPMLPLPRMFGRSDWVPVQGTPHVWHLEEDEVPVSGARGWELLWRYLIFREPWYDPRLPDGVLATEETGRTQVVWLGVQRRLLREDTPAARLWQEIVAPLEPAIPEWLSTSR